MRETADHSGTIIARTAGTKLAKLTPDALSAVARHGDELVEPVIAKLGDDGARAMRSLSPQSARTFVNMSDDLAASPYRNEWLDLITTYGDRATEWLWARKGSIAVGTMATAVVLKPEAFFQAGEHVAVSAIETTGSDFIKPVIEESAEHIAEPIANRLTDGVLAPVLIGTVACFLFILWYGRSFLFWFLPRKGGASSSLNSGRS
jgi:hypothetical protein